MSPRPNTFIIGAPKSGTTSIARWLGEHPDVFMSTPKEPYYFCRPSLQLAGIREPEQYAALFAAAQDALVIAEATTAILYDDTALPRILRFAPDARIIVMLRNPVELTLSWYGECVRHLRENIGDFPTAWEAIEDRRVGKRIPPECADPLMLDYRYIASLGSHLGRVRKLVPTKQLHVAFLDDFVTDPRTAWLQLLEFLNLPDDRRAEFAAENVGYFKGNVASYRALRALADKAKQLLRLRGGTGLVEKLARGHRKRRPRLDEEFRSVLRREFEPEISALEQITGRDLSQWRRQS